MDPARRWQVASVVTAAASLGLGAFALQRPATESVEPIDLDVLSTRPVERVDELPALSRPDAVIVAPDLLERMPTPPSATSTGSPEAPTSVDDDATSDAPDPATTATSPPASEPSVASPAEPAEPPEAPEPAEPTEAESVDEPDGDDSLDSADD